MTTPRRSRMYAKYPTIAAVGFSLDAWPTAATFRLTCATLSYEDRLCPVPQICLAVSVLLSDNQAVDNPGSGFAVQLNMDLGAGTILLQNNVARGAGTGFSVQPGRQDGEGTARFAQNVSLVGNVAVHSGFGFDTSLMGRMDGNTAAGNSKAGFLVVPGGAVFRDNSAIGNAGPGVIVNFSADGWDNGTSGRSRRHRHRTQSLRAQRRLCRRRAISGDQPPVPHLPVSQMLLVAPAIKTAVSRW